MNYQTPDRLLSIVAPCFNEAEGLEAFHTALTTAVASLPYDVEIIYVDDGSTDATPQVLARLRARDARVKTLTFSRNFGHQAALLAGLDAARGRPSSRSTATCNIRRNSSRNSSGRGNRGLTSCTPSAAKPPTPASASGSRAGCFTGCSTGDRERRSSPVQLTSG
ncbi:glycosyltransferase [Chloracidobacterium sp. 2]|nr:glycosyltransferase [Chloracidobacterium sp. 2]